MKPLPTPDRGSVPEQPTRVVAGGAMLDLLDHPQLLELVGSRLSASRRPLVIASSNLDHVTHFGTGGAHRDPAAHSVDADWLVTADGMPLVGAARLMTDRRWPQLAGSDLLPQVLEVAQRQGATVGFVGGTPLQHDELRAALADAFPRLEVRGFWSPTRSELHRPDGAADLADQVQAAGVDVLVVGLGKPRQELWLEEHLTRSGAKVALAFGAAADNLAGTAQRAPERWRRFGLEWLYRLISEPRRLWRRYLLQGPVAVWRMIRWSAGPAHPFTADAERGSSARRGSRTPPGRT